MPRKGVFSFRLWKISYLPPSGMLGGCVSSACFVLMLRRSPTMHLYREQLSRRGRRLACLLCPGRFLLWFTDVVGDVDMSQRPQEHFRRGLPTEHGRVRRVLEYEAGEGTSRQQPPPPPPRIQRPWSRSRYPPTVDDIIATPRKHRGVFRGIRRRQKLLDKEIHDYFGGDSSDEEVREVGGDQEWSSDEDISPAEDSGDEYVPPGSRGERESDLEFSGFSGLEEEEEEEQHSVSVVVEESDGESEGDGREVPRGNRRRGRGRARGGARGRARSPASSGDEGRSEDPTPPVMHSHTERPGITVPVPTTVLGFVQLFLTRELLEYFVDETNDYARYCRQELNITLSYKWHRCNLTDMAHYLGLLVFFGQLVCGDVRQYWRRGFFMATPNVAGLMTRDAFLAMDRYFHVFNRRAIPRGNQDKLILVRPLMEYLQNRCRMLVVPSKNLSLDEGLLAYKGRLSIKVYNPKKPKKYGVKFFFVTESNTGYVLDISIYSGVFSTLCDTLFQLVDRFRGKGYHLFMDNYYNSIALAQELYDTGIRCSGTLRLVRGAPTVLKDVGQNPRLLPKGETLWRRKKDVFCILWNDIRLVPMITTSHEPIREEVTQRRKKRQHGRVHYEEVQVQRPTVIGHYNRHMGGSWSIWSTHPVLPLHQKKQALDGETEQVPPPVGVPKCLCALPRVQHGQAQAVSLEVPGGGRGRAG